MKNELRCDLCAHRKDRYCTWQPKEPQPSWMIYNARFHYPEMKWEPQVLSPADSEGRIHAPSAHPDRGCPAFTASLRSLANE